MIPEAVIIEQPDPWALLSAREVPMKNMGLTAVREIVNRSIRVPSQSAEDRAREGLAKARAAGQGGREGTQTHER